jgi:hypothetical protein
VVGVIRERREEKRALVPFVPKRLMHRGGGKGGGSGAGVTRGGEQGGVRHGRGAQRGRALVEQKPGRGGDGGVGGRVGTGGWQVGRPGGWGLAAERRI